MRWTNKGHELDAKYGKFSEVKIIYIYGAGDYGKNVYEDLQQEEVEIVFVDQDKTKQVGNYCGKEVIDPSEISKIDKEKSIIILAMSCNNVEEVSKKLISIGLSEKKDFFEYFIWQEYYYPIFMWYYSGKIVIKYVDLSVTQCCNLRCKDCSILTPYVKQPKHRKIEDLQADVDILFKNIDRLETLYIIGGEPLLYPNLCKICDYIAVNYSNCISRLKIATNALIDLSEDMIKTFQKSRIEIQISDYSESVYGANKRINIFCQKLDDNNIKYYRMTDAVWCDYGFRNQCTYRTDEKMRSFFDECKIDCRGLEDAKFYYCFPTQMITKLDGFNNEEDLYLDLKHTTKEEIFEFNLGYSDKGFMNICRKCNGSYRNNKKYIDVALQLTNEEDK